VIALPAAFSVSGKPLQTAVLTALTVSPGRGFTVYVTKALLMHPFVSVPATEYVKGDTTDTVLVAATKLPVVADRPTGGFQV
jgi:hypothetical protein